MILSGIWFLLEAISCILSIPDASHQSPLATSFLLTTAMHSTTLHPPSAGSHCLWSPYAQSPFLPFPDGNFHLVLALSRTCPASPSSSRPFTYSLTYFESILKDIIVSHDSGSKQSTPLITLIEGIGGRFEPMRRSVSAIIMKNIADDSL